MVKGSLCAIAVMDIEVNDGDTFQVVVFRPEKSWFRETDLEKIFKMGNFSRPRRETRQFGKGMSLSFKRRAERVTVPVV